MENKICCCFGHRDLLKEVSVLPSVLEEMIVKEDVTIFITGGMGNFDGQFASAVRKLKTKYPQIKLVLVKPYFSSELNTNKEYYETMFDSVIVPDAVAGVHYKSAITKRNRWMIENSDFIVSCVYRDFGGAFEAIKYASKLNKKIINQQ